MNADTMNGPGSNLITRLEERNKFLGINHDTYLKGLLELKPLTYWDYAEVDTLLSLQRPRTGHKDEEVFIMYHQVTELMLKLMLHEIKQIVFDNVPDETLFVKVTRLNRYTENLINSFDIMKYGIDYDEYNIFRCALAPASGFQSAQFRYIELYCTRLQNLVDAEGREKLPADAAIEDYFKNIYWRDAGTNRSSGRKSLTLQQFEDKYLRDFISTAYSIKGRTIEERIAGRKLPENLCGKLREFDYLYNVKWPLVHLETAAFFLDSKGENKDATGGSKWKQYLHPASQQRKFFPHLWKEQEIMEWKPEFEIAEL
jgi:tryptophan 2,3-dioxygenase